MEKIRFRDTDWYNTVTAVFPDGHELTLTGWNGERWNEGRPIYRFDVEGLDISALEENSPEWDHAIEIIDIE